MFGGDPQFPASTSASKLLQCRGCGTVAADRMREQAASNKPVAVAISRRENASSFGCDLALEPRLLALTRMLARPAAIATMPFADRLASRAVHGHAAPRIVAGYALCGKCLACSCNRAQTMLAPRFRHACIAMPAPALEYWLGSALILNVGGTPSHLQRVGFREAPCRKQG